MITNQNISAFEARTHLGELLDRVRYTRTPYFIERHGKVVAVLQDLVSYQEAQRPQSYQRWITEAIEQIKKHYQPEKIILFGSAARGTFREGSDIDLLIIKKTTQRKWERSREVLSLLSLDNPVEPQVFTPEEIVERQEMDDPFLREIFMEGKILYEAKE